MKTIAAAVTTFSLVLVSVGTTSQTPMMKLSEVLLFHVPDVNADADAKAFEAQVFTELAPALRKSAPGWTLHLVRKDRGNRPGRYVLALMTDVRTRRQGSNTTSTASPLIPLLKMPTQAIEYHLVGADKVGPLPDIDVLGIHYIKVRPDRRDAFDRFIVEKLHPAVGTLRPDLRLLYYKPIGGDDPGNYITVFALTRESRDKYWPKGQDSEVLKAAFKPVQPLTEELKTYLVEGTYATGNLAAAVYESKEWADWVLVPAQK